MANIVTYDARPDIPFFGMSNGLTSIFISVLSLASSHLAENDHEREFAEWFASHDQTVFGIGMVSFDISELPWSPDGFANDREYVLRVIDKTKERVGWERLGYEPRVELGLLDRLNQFRMMVEQFTVEHATKTESEIWKYGKPIKPQLCEVHRIYLHDNGCLLCNEESPVS